MTPGLSQAKRRGLRIAALLRVDPDLLVTVLDLPPDEILAAIRWLERRQAQRRRAA